MFSSKVFLVAALAVCAIVSADIDFTPHPLGCEYVITIESNTTIVEAGSNETTSETDIIYRHGTYGKLVENQTLPTPAYFEIIARTDLRQEGTMYVYVFQTDSETGECVGSTATRYAVAQKVKEATASFINTQTYVNKTTGQFEGKDCDVYYRYDDGVDIWAYVDSDGFYLGELWISGDSSRQLRYSYAFEAPLSVFTFDKEKHSGCSDEAYTAPTLDTCDPSTCTFQPNPLPCAYTITVNATVFTGNDQIKSINYFYVHGDYFQGIGKTVDVPNPAFTQTLIRPDIKFPSDMIGLYEVDSDSGSTCIGKPITVEEAANTTKEYVSLFTEPIQYEAVVETKCFDQACTYYYAYDDEEDTTGILIVINGYFVESTAIDPEVSAVMDFTYDFNAPLKYFVIDKQFSGCNDSAYVAPTIETCGSSSSTSPPPHSSAASSNKASLVFIIGAIACTLFSLFF